MQLFFKVFAFTAVALTYLGGAPTAREAWSLGGRAQFVVPEDKWLFVTDGGTSSHLTVRTEIDANILFYAAGPEMAACITASRWGVPCPPGSVVSADANRSVRGVLNDGAPEGKRKEDRPSAKNVVARHAFVHPTQSHSAHLITVPAGYQFHLTRVAARPGVPVTLRVDGDEVPAGLSAEVNCAELKLVYKAGQVIELASTDGGSMALGAVFGYLEELSGR